MSININNLDEAELVDLNNRIVERLRFLHQARAYTRILDFRISDRVSFRPDGRLLPIGVLVRYNKRAVSVVTDGGERWNVSPSILHRVVASGDTNAQYPTVVPVRKG